MNARHPSLLFQADDQIELGRRRAAKAARLCVLSSSSSSSSASSSASLGHPIFLGTKQDDVAELALRGSGADGGREKVLDALLERGRGMWTAESGGMVRRVDLKTGTTTDVASAHTAPASALALLPLPSRAKALLFSSGWDKVIHVHLVVPLSSSATMPASPRRLEPLVTIAAASTDLVKALDVLPEHAVVVSGGSEKVLRIWDIGPLVAWCEAAQETMVPAAPPPVPRCLGSFAGHTRPITSIASLPASPLVAAQLPSTTTIYTADSMGRIFQLSLLLAQPPSTATSLPPRATLVVQRELRGPETAITDLHVGWNIHKEEEKEEEEEDDDDDHDGESAHKPTPSRAGALVQAQVWAASNDKTVQLFIPFEHDSRASSSRRSTTSRAAFGQEKNPSPLSRVSKVGPALGAQPPLSPILVIRHDDYVKSVLPLATRDQQEGLPKNLVISGSADEDLRLWRVGHLDAGDEEDDESEEEEEEVEADKGRRPLGASGVRLLRRQQGHWHEVEKLLLWRGTLTSPTLPSTPGIQEEDKHGQSDLEKKQQRDSPSKGKVEGDDEEWFVISASLDGSIRRWPLLSLLLTPQSSTERTIMENANLPIAINPTSSPPIALPLESHTALKTTTPSHLPTPLAVVPKFKANSGMTAEEERELEELMSNDDDDDDDDGGEDDDDWSGQEQSNPTDWSLLD